MATKENQKTDSKINLEALDWEASRIHIIEKSEKRAWFIAQLSFVVMACSLAALFFMLPLKESTPYVVRVDNSTGIPDIITAMKDTEISGDDVMDKYWLASYIRARETYDWYSLQNDYNTVGLLSADVVGKEYAKLFTGKKALDQLYGKNIKVNVKIISIVPNGGNTATVRFAKRVKRVDDSGFGNVTKWTATISYKYLTRLKMKESERLVNPFGFKVLSYRIDPEIVGAPR